MSGLNLSDWALRNRSIVVYLMVLAVLAAAGQPVPTPGRLADLDADLVPRQATLALSRTVALCA